METRMSLWRKADDTLISTQVYFDLLKWNSKAVNDVRKVVYDAIQYGYKLGLKDAAEIIEKRKLNRKEQ